MSAAVVKIYRDQELIGGQIILAANFFSRFRGLLWRAELKEGEGLLLVPCRQVHTFFMTLMIDVLFLDREARIVEILPKMVPGRISPVVREAYQVLELPADTVQKWNINKGEQLIIAKNSTTDV